MSRGPVGDSLPSQYGWIHELARAEVHPEAEKILELGKSFDPHQVVEESTIDFLTELREYFTEYARVFNSYSEKGTTFQDLKLYSVAQTPADFMLYRNQVKLTVANTAHGVIQFQFSRHTGSGLGAPAGASVDGQGLPTGLNQSQELLAQVGPFRDVYWTFQGERVEAGQVARFYFAEFSRASRNQNRSRLSNQLLIEQIKNLLEEKGLTL